MVDEVLGLGFSAFVLATLGTFLLRRHAINNKWLDIPNTRSSHKVAVPTGGGAAIAISFFVAVFILRAARVLDLAPVVALVCGGAGMATIGFIDDRYPLSPRVRICVHLASAILAVVMLGAIPAQSLVNIGLHSVYVGWALSVLTLIWSSNLFNFMDGIDGLAGSEAIFVAGSAAWLNWLTKGDQGLTAASICLASATLGFLMWNWPRAKIFMGDVGSGFLGFTLAALILAMSREGSLPIEVLGILGGVFVVDATYTLLRRLLRGDRIFEAHRIHAYQHLAGRWGSHEKVTVGIAVVNLFWLLPWAWFACRNPKVAMIALCAALSPIVAAAALSGAGRKENIALRTKN
jgi:Fuc2NAc and GlcNAc transferase